MVSVCEACGLVQIVDPVDPEVLFQDYSFATGTVAGLVKHFDAYAAWIADIFRPGSVVEFGCNDGTLLASLEERGIRSVGVDLSANITEMARAQGRNALTGSFGPEIVDTLRDEAGPVDLITGSNVFAHNADPAAILQAVDQLLTPDGVLVLEVMYAADLLEQLQWDTLYHEHLTFYSLGDAGRPVAPARVRADRRRTDSHAWWVAPVWLRPAPAGGRSRRVFPSWRRRRLQPA